MGHSQYSLCSNHVKLFYSSLKALKSYHMPSPALAVMFQCVQCRDTAICWQVSLAFCCFPNVWTAELEFLRFGKKIPKYSTGQLTLHNIQAWRHVIKLELEIFKRCFIDLLQSIFYYCWIYIYKKVTWKLTEFYRNVVWLRSCFFHKYNHHFFSL